MDSRRHALRVYGVPVISLPDDAHSALDMVRSLEVLRSVGAWPLRR